MASNSWEITVGDCHGQSRYIGNLSTDEPMAFLCKVYDSSGYYYCKTPKNDELEHEFDCLLHTLPKSRLQAIFSLRHAVSFGAVWAEGTFVFTENGTFEEGVPFTIARFRTGEPAIELLGLSCSKLKNLRNKIWRVKDSFLESVNEPNKEILLRTRNGYVKTGTSVSPDIIQKLKNLVLRGRLWRR